jgi:PIN domain nuclease of toxin-antitoxin system
LSPRARRLVETGENVVSVASYWEVVIKTQKGLLTVSDLPTWWRRATELTTARVLHIRGSHITALAALPMLHKDPFDRILIAQAKAEGLVVVTSDASFTEYPIRTLW